MDHILSIVLFTPIVGTLILFLIPSSNTTAIRWWANIVAFVGFLVSLPLVFEFDRTKDFQFVEQASWIPSIGASYHLGIDGLGLLLVMLTTVVGFIAILASWTAIQDRLKEYYAFFLILQTGMLGVFMAQDFLSGAGTGEASAKATASSTRLTACASICATSASSSEPSSWRRVAK